MLPFPHTEVTTLMPLGSNLTLATKGWCRHGWGTALPLWLPPAPRG